VLNVENMIFDIASMLDIDIAGATQGTLYDVLNSTGALTLLTGSTLKLDLSNGFLPDFGNSFDILNFSSLSGMFSTLDLPSLNAGLFWDTSSLYQNGTLLVVPEPAITALILSALGAILISKMVSRSASGIKTRFKK
jgi:hypothetical protein